MHSVYHFDTATEALRVCGTGQIPNGSVLVIDNDCVIGLASDPPRAVTTHSGPLKPFLGQSRSAILAESEHDALHIGRAVDEAHRHGYPISEALTGFGSLRSQMSPSAREYHLTGDEVLALVEACDKRIEDYRRLLGEDIALTTSQQIWERVAMTLESARAKLLTRPL